MGVVFPAQGRLCGERDIAGVAGRRIKAALGPYKVMGLGTIATLAQLGISYYRVALFGFVAFQPAEDLSHRPAHRL